MKEIKWLFKWFVDPNESKTFVPFRVIEKPASDCLIISRTSYKKEEKDFISDWMDWKTVSSWKKIKPTDRDLQDMIIYSFVAGEYFEGLE